MPATVRHKFPVNFKNIPVHLTLKYPLYIERSAAVSRSVGPDSNGVCCRLSGVVLLSGVALLCGVLLLSGVVLLSGVLQTV